MSAQKRRISAPLPIFNKSKRPRQALLAHPNNTAGAQHAQPGSLWNASSSPGPYNSAYGLQQKNDQQPYSMCSYAIKHDTQQQSLSSGYREIENRPPYYPTGAKELCQWSGQQKQRPNSYPHNPPGRQFGTLVNGALPMKKTASNPMPAPAAPGRAQEPTNLHAAKTAPDTTPWRSSPLRQSRRSLRVLTASAKGMQHWSKFKHQTAMIFEVFGVVYSPVSLEPTGAKQFSLKTSDGIVRCCFWEMDRKLPHLIRGHMHRVLGQWDTQRECLKSYSVRPVHPNEEQGIRRQVEASDRSMRQLVAALPEV